MGNKEVEIYTVEEIDEFTKNVKRLIKKKKFFSLPKQIDELISDLEQGKFDGDKITHRDVPTPYDVYKLRLQNVDTNSGKSNGYRVIYFVVTEEKVVVLLTIYYKKKQADVEDIYVDGLINGYFMSKIPIDESEDEEPETDEDV